MYQKYYHFNADPFCLNPDPRFSYAHPSYKKAKNYMMFALNRGEGFLLITGKPGTGKTTLIKELVKELEQSRFKFSTLVTTQLEADDLLRSVAYSFDLPIEKMDKASVIEHLKRYLTNRRRQNRHSVLIVDEAQDLSERAMEELRLLTNLELNDRPLLQIFLVGQPQLYDLLGSRSLDQLRQRITVAAAMQPLCTGDIEEYVQCRLTVAGWQHDPELSKDIYPLIYQCSDGIPRRINQICSRLLLHGFVEDRHSLDLNDINAVMKELSEEHLSDTYTILQPQSEPDREYVSFDTTVDQKELH